MEGRLGEHACSRPRRHLIKKPKWRAPRVRTTAEGRPWVSTLAHGACYRAVRYIACQSHVLIRVVALHVLLGWGWDHGGFGRQVKFEGGFGTPEAWAPIRTQSGTCLDPVGTQFGPNLDLIWILVRTLAWTLGLDQATRSRRPRCHSAFCL